MTDMKLSEAPLRVPSLLLLLLLRIAITITSVDAEPLSPPYVAYRTDPFSTPPSSTKYQQSSLFGDKIPNVVLGARRGDKVGSRGKSKVRPVEVSPASTITNESSTRRDRGDGSGAAASGRVGGQGDPRCPLAFRLGLTHQSSSVGGRSSSSRSSNAGFTGGINGPVVTYPAHPSSGPGRQVVFVENWERLDMLTPSTPPTGKAARRGEEESMEIDEQFPLLFEGANFYHSVPLLHDENGDGIVDATVIDYDGGVYSVGLDYNPSSGGGGNRERYVKTTQVPRLYLRRDWVESATNLTKMEEFRNPDSGGASDEEERGHRYQTDYPPFHSYFEYGLEWKEDHDNARIGVSGGVVSADVLTQSVEDVRKIEDERVRRWKEAQDEILNKKKGEDDKEAKTENGGDDEPNEAEVMPELDEGGGDAARGDRRRRLQEVISPADDAADAADAEDPIAATAEDVGDGEEEAKARDKPEDPVTGREEGEEAHEKPGEPVVAASGREEEEPDEVNADLGGEKDGVGTSETTEGKGGEEDGPEVIDAISVKKKKEKPDKKVEGEPCGDCYGAGEADDCCNSCAQVVAAYKKKNWGYKKADIVQCVEEDDLEDDKIDDKRYGVDDDYPEGTDDINGVDDEYRPAKYDGVDDDYRSHQYDDYYPRDYDDYYASGHEHYNNFYSDENYIRVTPHVLARPVYVEIPKRYKSSEDAEWAVEEFLVVPVSYYMDEDEFKGLQSYRRFKNKEGGDETETERGQFVASAVLFYNNGYKQWSTQTHLDLSTDWTSPVNTTVGDAAIHDNTYNGYGAFALSSPTVASFGDDFDNNPKYCVIMGTSMGLLYVLDVPGAARRDGFPVRFPYPIIRRAVVEDVSGDVTPEIIAVDSGGNIACFDSDGNTLWHRDVIEGERNDWSVAGTSEISLGDLDGDGNLDVVIIVRLVATAEARDRKSRRLDEVRVYVVEADSGDDLARFPMSIDVKSAGLNGNDRRSAADAELPLPQPLLVDLHASQDHWLERIRRNETENTRTVREQDAAEARRINNDAAGAALPGKNSKVPHGGMGRGLHIVQPINDFLYIIEGGTGCAQTINVGDTIPSMVQVDDVHGTGALDLIVTTASGQILTLEASDQVPFHPLNVWGTGPVRSRINGHAQGYSATSGIFVHDRSRTYKNWLGIYVVVTFDIFDRRPNVWKEDPDKRKYLVDMRYGTSAKKMMFRKTYERPGTYTEQVFVPFGPGYYTVTARLTTTHGLVYEDVFSLGYNINFDTGLAWIVLVPLIVAAIPLLSVRRKANWEEDDDFRSGGAGGGILG